MKQIALSEIKDNLPRFLREASAEQIVITRHGRPAGVLVGFASEDDWFDYRLEHDPSFLDRIASARASIQAGHGVRIEDLDTALKRTKAPNQALRTGAAVTPAASSRPPARPPRSGRAGRARR
jgi:prevent-host-death family protein